MTTMSMLSWRVFSPGIEKPCTRLAYVSNLFRICIGQSLIESWVQSHTVLCVISRTVIVTRFLLLDMHFTIWQ